MPRKKTTHRLRPLPASGAPLTAREHKTERLVEILRGVAALNQRQGSRSFYAVRDVAKHFRVSGSLVARAYKQLEDEGLLSAVRGSRTILQGRHAVRHLKVLGFIGVPAAVSSFVALQDYRSFFIRMRRELRARGFAVAMVLFEPSDAKSGRLDKRLRKYNFDTVLWYRPDVLARNVISRLQDEGAHVIAISDYYLSPIHNRYEIHRENAISQIFRYWHAKVQINSVLIVRGVRASPKEDTLQKLLDEEGLGFDFRNADAKSAARFLKSLARTKNRGVIFPSWAASQLSFREPEALMQLLDSAHVAFTGGPPSIPFAQIRDVHADLVVVDWQLIAERIVGDLISRRAFDRGDTTIFKAKAHIRALLSQYAQVI